MIVYKIEKADAESVNKQLADIQVVLDEITPSLQILRRMLAEHEQAIDSPALQKQRLELVATLTQAIGLTHTVSQQSRALTRGSQVAAKHLGALDAYILNTMQNPGPHDDRSEATSKVSPAPKLVVK